MDREPSTATTPTAAGRAQGAMGQLSREAAFGQ